MTEQVLTKKNTESPNRLEQIQQMFFSKDSISNLNKSLLQHPNLNNLTREGKQHLINILVKNMKTVYRSIDLNKINTTNFKSIYDQFRDHSIKQSLVEVKQNNYLSNYAQSTSELKFERDFNSNPNPGNKFIDRPETTKVYNPSNLNQMVSNLEHKRNEQKKMNDPFSGFSSDMNNYDSNLDQVFKPIVDNINDDNNNYFNNYSSNRGNDINGKMEEIQKMRQTEIHNRNKRPTTPEFLKSKKSNPDRDNVNRDNVNKTNFPIKSGEKPDFKNADSSHFNNGFQGLANDISGELYSLDNIDKPLIDAEIVEDKTSFEDRLKRLQTDRNSLKPINQQKDVNFTSDNFPQSNIGNNEIPQEHRNNRNNQPNRPMQDYNEVNRQTPENRNNQPNRPMQDYNEVNRQTPENRNNQPNRQMQDYNEVNRQTSENRNNQPNRQMQDTRKNNDENKSLESIRQIQETRKQLEEPKQTNDRFANLKNSMRSVNIDVKEDTRQFKIIIEKLNQENRELKEIVNKFRENSDLEKISEIKRQIANEFDLLNSKSNEIENKINDMSLKEIELAKKKTEVQQLIDNYDYLFKTKQLQVEVSDRESRGKYTWSMDKIHKVTGIKLMAYSLPKPIFNIEENKNNILHMNINNNDCKIIVPTGKYEIQDLIHYLNEEVKKTYNDININLNIQQKVVIGSDNETDNITIIPTLLTEINLGFTGENKNKNKHIATKLWDLRIEDKVYLYLTNLSEEVPFGLLYFNGQSVSQFKFQEPFNLDHLDILFKDSRGFEYNFYNLNHSLSFIIEKLE
jgi:hypothetical protein